VKRAANLQLKLIDYLNLTNQKTITNV